MGRKKGFTMIELVIVLAVSSILFAIIAGLSILTNGLVKSQKLLVDNLSDYQESKTDIESFISKYSFDYYTIELPEENVAEIYVASEMENMCVARLVFENDSKTFTIYELNSENNLVATDTKVFSNLSNLKFNIDEDEFLLKCIFVFKDFDEYKFLVDLGGMNIGNLY